MRLLDEWERNPRTCYMQARNAVTRGSRLASRHSIDCETGGRRKETLAGGAFASREAWLTTAEP